MQKLEAFQIVGITLWYVLGAVSVPVGWVYTRMTWDKNDLIHTLVFWYTVAWTLYWIIQGWPKIGGGV